MRLSDEAGTVLSIISAQWPVNDQSRDGIVTHQTPATGRVPQGSAMSSTSAPSTADERAR
jgi:hypothetical protein